MFQSIEVVYVHFAFLCFQGDVTVEEVAADNENQSDHESEESEDEEDEEPEQDMEEEPEVNMW